MDGKRREVGYIQISPIRREDLPGVRELHFAYLPTNLPRCAAAHYLMEYYYESFLITDHNLALTAKNGGEVVGYICLVGSARELYGKLLRNHPGAVIMASLEICSRYPVAFLKDMLKRLRSLLTGGRKTATRLLAGEGSGCFTPGERWYELRPIVVMDDYRGKSLALDLVRQAEEVLQARGEKQYFLRVYRNNRRAIGFYQKAGLKVGRTEREQTLLMVKHLP